MADIQTTVEIAFFDVPFEQNPSWIDATAHVLLVQGQIQIRRGRPDEFSAIQPGTLSLLVDNTDGFFVPEGPPIEDPSVLPYKRIRVRTTIGDVTVSRFDGHVTSWSYSWRGGQSVVAIQASDRLALVSGVGALRSFLAEEILSGIAPFVYLPLSDGEGATRPSNLGTTVEAATVRNLGGGGEVTFGSGTGPPADGASAVQLAPASPTSGFFVEFPFRGAIALLGYTVQAWVAGSTASQTIVALTSSGAVIASLGFDASRRLTAMADSGLLTATSVTVVADGGTHHVAMTVTADGTNHTLRVYVDADQVATATRADPSTVTSRPDRMLVGSTGVGSLLAGTVSHVALHPTALTGTRIATIYHAGADGFGGERSDQRVSRIASYVGLASQTPTSVSGVWLLGDTTASVLGTTTVLAATDLALEQGVATVWGQSTGGSDPASALQEVALTEGGVVLVDRDGFLAMQNRQHRYNAEDKIVLDANEVDDDLVWAMDDQQLVTEVTASTQDDVTFRVADGGFALNNFGRRPDNLSLLTRDPLDAMAAAQWRLGRYSVPAWRANGVSFDILTLPDDRAKTLLALDISDAFRIATGLDPTQSPVTDVRLVLEGYTETISASQYRIECNTSSASVYQVWTLGDTQLSILGETTTLAY